MRKTSRCRVFPSEGKAGPCWVVQGDPSQKPLCSPPGSDNGTERNYLFSKRLSGGPRPGCLVSMQLGSGLLSRPRSWWASRRRRQGSQQGTAQQRVEVGVHQQPWCPSYREGSRPSPLGCPPGLGKAMTSENGGAWATVGGGGGLGMRKPVSALTCPSGQPRTCNCWSHSSLCPRPWPRPVSASLSPREGGPEAGWGGAGLLGERAFPEMPRPPSALSPDGARGQGRLRGRGPIGGGRSPHLSAKGALSRQGPQAV